MIEESTSPSVLADPVRLKVRLFLQLLSLDVRVRVVFGGVGSTSSLKAVNGSPFRQKVVENFLRRKELALSLPPLGGWASPPPT